MTLRYTILASGSAANASLIQTPVSAILLDAGLGPQDLSARAAQAGHNLDSVRAMLLTHTHTDHWKDRTFAWMHEHGIGLYCHVGHHAALKRASAAFRELVASRLVYSFTPGVPFYPVPGLNCMAFDVRHDAGATFGFRIEGPGDLLGRRAVLGYASDLGTWCDEVADALRDVDLLALEFNHDVAMQRQSSRPAMLIARVLGDEGHLSNEQATALVKTVIERSAPGRLRHLVQLHLSRECNRPEMARRAATVMLREIGAKVRVQTAEQDVAGKTLSLDPTTVARTRSTKTVALAGLELDYTQAWLPGMGP